MVRQGGRKTTVCRLNGQFHRCSPRPMRSSNPGTEIAMGAMELGENICGEEVLKLAAVARVLQPRQSERRTMDGNERQEEKN